MDTCVKDLGLNIKKNLQKEYENIKQKLDKMCCICNKYKNRPIQNEVENSDGNNLNKSNSNNPNDPNSNNPNNPNSNNPNSNRSNINNPNSNIPNNPNSNRSNINNPNSNVMENNNNNLNDVILSSVQSVSNVADDDVKFYLFNLKIPKKNQSYKYFKNHLLCQKCLEHKDFDIKKDQEIYIDCEICKLDHGLELQGLSKKEIPPPPGKNNNAKCCVIY